MPHDIFLYIWSQENPLENDCPDEATTSTESNGIQIQTTISTESNGIQIQTTTSTESNGIQIQFTTSTESNGILIQTSVKNGETKVVHRRVLYGPYTIMLVWIFFHFVTRVRKRAG